MIPIILSVLMLILAFIVLYINMRRMKQLQTNHGVEIQHLQQALLAAQCDSRDLYFSRILDGGFFRTEEELISAGTALNIYFPYGFFIVLSAKLETWGELFTTGHMNIKDLYFILRNVLEDTFPGHTNAAEVQGHMIAILNLDNLPEAGLWGIVQDAQHALEVLEAEFGLTVTVAISRVYHTPVELSHAMHDVNDIFDYLQLMDIDSPITTYEDLTYLNISQSTTSILDLETRLLGCIRSADFAQMRLILHELICNEFNKTKPTVDIFRFRLYGVVNTLLYLINDIRTILGDNIITEIDPGPRLTSAKTLDEIVTVMDDILDQLEAHVTSKFDKSCPAWVMQVPSFVEENYRNPDLTLTSIADHFHVTPTYCTRMFRQKYRTRLFDLIQLKRVEAAKALMRSGKNLSEIAMETGFSSTVTMNRTFKRYEGTSPTKLREQILHQSSLI